MRETNDSLMLFDSGMLEVKGEWCDRQGRRGRRHQLISVVCPAYGETQHDLKASGWTRIMARAPFALMPFIPVTRFASLLTSP